MSPFRKSDFEDIKINAFSNEQYAVFRKFLYGCVGAITIFTGAASYKIVKTFVNEQAYTESQYKLNKINEDIATAKNKLDALEIYKKNLDVEVVNLQQQLKDKDLLNPCRDSIEWYEPNSHDLNGKQMKCNHPQHEFKIVNSGAWDYSPHYFSCTCKK